MNALLQRTSWGGAAFRLRLLFTMMIVIAAITSIGLYVGQRNLEEEATRNLQQQFQSELASLHSAQEVRHAALAERCRALVRKPRIHAALEDNALDLLYPSARDELRDIMERRAVDELDSRVLRGAFYRFLDAQGAVIPAPDATDVGELTPLEESMLSLKTAPHDQQLGYIPHGKAVIETITLPIVSTESGEVIAALALGLRPIRFDGKNPEMKRGIWMNDHVYLTSIDESSRAHIAHQISDALHSNAGRLSALIGGVPHLIFFKRLNIGSAYPLACEVCVFPLTDLLTRQRHVRWQIITAGALTMLAGFFVSHFASGRLSKPVEKLAEDRDRAETALEQTSVELQRSVRFSADASHQLKTPVAVLRAGLEDLLAHDSLAHEAREEISQLVHQTYRLNGVIEDLLLLSRMDAGRLQLSLAPVDLSQLVETELDDLSAQSDEHNLVIDAHFPAGILIAGEKRYTTMIVRNLLENARKYNKPGGCIRVVATRQPNLVRLTISNTGSAIPAAAREHIFERFHRGAAGENIPGHGLGLNLARELVRLHGGDVRLVRSDENWTEFQITFCPARVEEAA